MSVGTRSFAAALLLCAAAVVAASAQQASNVQATYNYYYPSKNSWDLTAVSAFCATWDASMPLSWREIEVRLDRLLRSRRPHRRRRMRLVPLGDEHCNRGAIANGGLDLDQGVFAQLDTDGSGYANGFLTVDYEFVDCGDS